MSSGMKRKRSAPIAVTILPLRDLYTTYGGHSRLSVFAELGRKCATCPREGNVLLASRDRGGGLHIDLYADHVLMTVDHIIPRSAAKRWNWPTASIESIRNKQPMCQPCNGKKGSRLPQHQWKPPTEQLDASNPYVNSFAGQG